MNYILSLLLLISGLLSTAFSQEYIQYEPTKADDTYREARMRKAIPPYGLEKTQRLIKPMRN